LKISTKIIIKYWIIIADFQKSKTNTKKTRNTPNFCIPKYFDMKNLMRMIILNFGRVTIKFEPYALRLEMQMFSQ
jgi:hypothetical protein